MTNPGGGGEAEPDAGLLSRLRFESFFADLAARFLKSPASALPDAIDGGLEGLLDVLDIDRCSLALFSPDLSTLVIQHSASRPGVASVQGTELARELPWWAERLRTGQRVILDFAEEDLPPEAEAERRFVAATGLKSHTSLPLSIGGQILGAFGAAGFARRRTWSDSFLGRLDLLASVFAHALYRLRSESDLARANALLEQRLKEIEALKDRLEAENVMLYRETQGPGGFTEIVGRSAALGRVLSQIEQVAPTDSHVLLLGETGTGKGIVARALHARSGRSSRPLLTVNCAALPTSLVESEIFGYERGAFTGALQRTAGRFEVADGGTILLDEIGEMPLDVQAKLLRVLQTGEFERLGSPRTIRSDVRVIAASNRDLDREVRQGRFRADLYYRLSVFPVTVPPLRDRPEDIPLLVWHFILGKQVKLGRSIKRVPDAVMRTLTAYAWPGNVRELENVVERALIVSQGPTLSLAAPLLSTSLDDGRPDGDATLEEVERAHIQAVLVACGWKVAGPGNAADRLGLNRSTLQFRMKKLGIERPPRVGR